MRASLSGSASTPAVRGASRPSVQGAILEGFNIICLANDWAGDPLSKKHIMRILASRNRVLWVNSIPMRRPTVSRQDLKKMVSKLGRLRRGSAEVEPNVVVACPLVLPMPGVALVDRLNAAILGAWLRRLCRQRGIDRPLLWTFHPHVSQLLGRLGERMVIYHCVDEYSAFSGVPREALIRMERDLIRRADVVFTSSQQLCDERRDLNPHTYFVSHGVDVEHFSQALNPATEVPEDIRHLRHPVVGFIGLLADWVDVELLEALALSRPEWSFVLVGKVVTDLGRLRQLRNVYVLGRRPYGMLPAYSRGFDVGVIPFRVNALTLRANPLKLREYLAAGLPVVSTPLPEVARYDGLVRLADDAQAFAAAIEAASGERSETMDRRRVEAMRAEGWDRRVMELSAIIAERLEGMP